ncbi:scavenger receptor class F member 1-like [Pecten maximus]|uniref:scavenger receptor class F member 1-like n=1 Tax=Pecten maximus TaxID=6579 RepID=UPI001458D76D|nr:scavenger receptor class F member 1-like [Pecten maximus]
MATGKILLRRGVILVLLVIFEIVRSESNVAVNKVAVQSSDEASGKYVASKVVDNCTNTDIAANCCTHTATGYTTAWWLVDLGEMMTINTITIYYRESVVFVASSLHRWYLHCECVIFFPCGFQYSLAGYQLYVSNTTNTPTDGDLCFEDRSSTRDAVRLVDNHRCSYVGQYVTVYNYRNNPKRYDWYSDDAILELCEVQVFGCQVGRYGDGNCNSLCPPGCYDGYCNSTTGACFYCFTGKYGVYCDSDCPANCKDDLCTKDAGTCLDCIPGRYGTRCELNCTGNCKDVCEKDTGLCIECIPGKYGNTCDQVCPENCKDMLCEKSTGNCIDCVPQNHGIICELNCSTNCLDSLCEKDNGSCHDCIPGKHGSSCDQNCQGNCKDMLCERFTGSCTECVTGKYGNACDQDCPGNCNDTLCRRDSGDCIDCIPGKHGTNCDQNCTGNCKDELCERYTGSCTECVTGKYGNACDQDCPRNCHDTLCRRDCGDCIDCVPQKYGIRCDHNCSTNCLESLCQKDNGICYDCTAGFYGTNCLMTCNSRCGECDQQSGKCTGKFMYSVVGENNICKKYIYVNKRSIPYMSSSCIYMPLFSQPCINS